MYIWIFNMLIIKKIKKKYFNIFINKNHLDRHIPWQVTKRECHNRCWFAVLMMIIWTRNSSFGLFGPNCMWFCLQSVEGRKEGRWWALECSTSKTTHPPCSPRVILLTQSLSFLPLCRTDWKIKKKW
jgi:hypothetical protein